MIRELREEFSITIENEDLEMFGVFVKSAGGQEDYGVNMTMYIVKSWKGELEPDNEVEEFRWIGSIVGENIEIGSILRDQVIPAMLSKNLID